MTAWLVAEIAGGGFGLLSLFTVTRVMWIAFSDDMFRNKVLHALRAKEKPDYALIGRLERELGLALPEAEENGMLSEALFRQKVDDRLDVMRYAVGSLGLKKSVAMEALKPKPNLQPFYSKKHLERLVPALKTKDWDDGYHHAIIHPDSPSPLTLEKPMTKAQFEAEWGALQEKLEERDPHDPAMDVIAIRHGDHCHDFTREVKEKYPETVKSVLAACDERNAPMKFSTSRNG